MKMSNNDTVGPQNHEAIKPLHWLIGTWRSISAEGFYPTIQPFTYCEEMTFESLGQPMLNYQSKTWHPVKKTPMHLENGFLRIKPGTTELSLLVAHNFGVTTLEEGCVCDNEINLKSTGVNRMSFAKDPAVIKIERIWKLNNAGKLETTVLMETSTTPLTEHLKVVLEKV